MPEIGTIMSPSYEIDENYLSNTKFVKRIGTRMLNNTAMSIVCISTISSLPSTCPLVYPKSKKETDMCIELIRSQNTTILNFSEGNISTFEI
jgi:hypothetical protein